jgi:hypothetical protein
VAGINTTNSRISNVEHRRLKEGVLTDICRLQRSGHKKNFLNFVIRYSSFDIGYSVFEFSAGEEMERI